MNDSIAQRFDVACRTYSDRPALLDGAGNPVTFERLSELVQALANTLIQHGFRPGQFVALHVGEHALHVALSLAVLRLGGCVTLYEQPIPRRSDGTPINFHIIDRDFESTDPRVLRINDSWLTPPSRLIPPRGSGAIITGTSGTTGVPKLQAMNEAVFLARMDVANRATGTPDGPTLVGYNPATTVGFRTVVVSLVLGQTHVMLGLDGERTIDQMIDYNVQFARMAPAGVKRLTEAASVYSGSLPKLRQMTVGGGTIATSVATEAERLFGCTLLTGYGSSESGPVAYFRVTDAPNTPGVVGRVLPHLAHKLVDDEGRESDRGEMHLRIPPASRNSPYLNSDGPYDDDGWLGTGDIGYIDPEGNFVITGRRAEFINSGGTKRAPSYFEAALARLPEIKEAVAFALPNDWGSEDVGLALETFDGPVAMERLASAMRQDVSRGFVFRVFFVDEIPHTLAGKVDRSRLSAECRGKPADLTLG